MSRRSELACAPVLPSDRERRENELRSLSPLSLAGLILDHGLILREDADPVELILDFEFVSRQTDVMSTIFASAARFAPPVKSHGFSSN